MSKITIEIEPNAIIKKKLPKIIIAFVTEHTLRRAMLDKMVKTRPTSFSLREVNYKTGLIFDGTELIFYYRTDEKSNYDFLRNSIEVKASDLVTFESVLKDMLEFLKGVFEDLSIA